MKIGFYPKLAASGIRKNRRLFTPFILTCTGMVMMFYIIIYLAASDALSEVVGGETLRSIFALGSWVIAVFSVIFLFYTNSFLIRRRKKEFGLYHILGMGKGNIARILFWETLLVAVISITLGLFAGAAFSKLAELGLLNMAHSEVTYDLSICPLAVWRSIQVFGVIFILLFLNSVRQVQFSTAISLLRSENAGEKPPKGNWLLGLLGVLILAAAYYLAVTIQDPATAILIFFVAVIMVIIGTYLIMIAGSVVFCRLLQKNKRYYYKPNHFVSVSSMVYRMKRNGAGLASICILATMVLVMISSTACLYFGAENAIVTRYPGDVNLSFRMKDASSLSDTATETVQGRLSDELAAQGVVPENGYNYRSAYLYGTLRDHTAKLNLGQPSMESTTHLFTFIPLADYNRVMGAQETLDQGEALLYTYRTKYTYDTLTFSGAGEFRIKKQLDTFFPDGTTAMDMLSSLTLVVPDLEESIQSFLRLADFNGDQLLRMEYTYIFDTDLTLEQQKELHASLRGALTSASCKDAMGYSNCTISFQALERVDYYSLFGALFYLGIMLSAVFILAAVLIIYYKQICEGYEDQSRFEIMKKIGMTKREIRKSINSQLLTVFFLPLVFAGLHLLFAFPMIYRMLLLFNLNNMPLFAATTGISLAVFAVFYAIVYRLTSNAYYSIVSGTREAP